MKRSVATPPELGRQIKRSTGQRLSELCASGYWLCQDCSAINSREEGEQGQPAHCGSCRSTRLKLQPAAFELIEPGDLL